MKFYNFLLFAVVLCTLQWNVSAKIRTKNAEYDFPKKINENSELYIVDIESAHHRFNLEKCVLIPSKKLITCKFDKRLRQFKYKIDIPIIREPDCEFNKETKIVEAKLWSMNKDTDVFKMNNEIKTEGRFKVLTTELFRAQHFQLTTNQDECVFKAEFETAKVSRIDNIIPNEPNDTELEIKKTGF